MATFAAQVGAWAAETRSRTEAVFKSSAQDLLEVAQTPVAQGGNMPVDTGFLRNSLVSGLNGSTSLSGSDSYVLAVAGAKLGDVIEAGWTAKYARFVEYGTSKMQARRFMGQAAAQWQAIVTRNAERLRNS